jgi:transposase
MRLWWCRGHVLSPPLPDLLAKHAFPEGVPAEAFAALLAAIRWIDAQPDETVRPCGRDGEGQPAVRRGGALPLSCGFRHLIENFFAKLNQFRAIATRYVKTARNFLADVHLVATAIWLN